MRYLLSFFALCIVIVLSEPIVFAQSKGSSFTSTTLVPTISSVSIVDLACTRKAGKIELTWQLQNNELADRLIVQRSPNGKKFEMVGLIFGTDKNEVDAYRFSETASNRKAYYRIIVVMKDQSTSYSPVVRLASE